MELTPPLHTSITVRKWRLEPEEEELELPDEFKPLAVSTPELGRRWRLLWSWGLKGRLLGGLWSWRLLM